MSRVFASARRKKRYWKSSVCSEKSHENQPWSGGVTWRKETTGFSGAWWWANEQRLAIFPTKWRANEQFWGWAPASFLFLNQPHLTTFSEFCSYFFFGRRLQVYCLRFSTHFFARLKLVAERRQPLREEQISRDEQKPRWMLRCVDIYLF